MCVCVFFFVNNKNILVVSFIIIKGLLVFLLQNLNTKNNSMMFLRLSNIM